MAVTDLDELYRIRARLLVGDIIRPVLRHLNSYSEVMGSEAAVCHLFAIAVHESAGLRFTRQLARGGGYGPARSLFQIEPETCNDVIRRIIVPRKTLWHAVQEIAAPDLMASPMNSRLEALRWDQRFAAAIARCRLLDTPDPIPAVDASAEEHAAHWLEAYNRTRGAEAPKRMASFVASFDAYVLPLRPELFGGAV